MAIKFPKAVFLNSGATLTNEVLYPHPCILLGWHAAHRGAQASWIQIHDSATVPPDGAVPIVTHQIDKDSDAHIEGILYNQYFENGIYICESDTVPTKTLHSTMDCFFTIVLEEATYNE